MENNAQQTIEGDKKHDTIYKCQNCGSESANEPGMCCGNQRELCEECMDQKNNSECNC